MANRGVGCGGCKERADAEVIDHLVPVFNFKGSSKDFFMIGSWYKHMRDVNFLSVVFAVGMSSRSMRLCF